jgi:hypothetical protein
MATVEAKPRSSKPRSSKPCSSSPWWVAVLGAVAIAGCGAPSGGATGPGPAPTTELDCERGGYACSLGAMSEATVQRGEELMLELATEVGTGATLEDVVAMARAEPDVIEARIDTSGRAMYFLLEGGAPMFVGGLEADANAGRAFELREDVAAAAGPTPRRGGGDRHVVVGTETPRDEDDGSQRKNALVLAPYKWQFDYDYPDSGPRTRSGHDSAPAIRDALADTFDYSDAWVGFPFEAGQGIRYVENDVGMDFGVTVEDFLGWHAYDVIFVSTHSHEVDCSGLVFRVCTSAVNVGLTDRPCSYWRAQYPDREGVLCETKPWTTPSGAPIYSVSLSSDFFASVYGGGLDRALIVFDSCESLRNDAFGWSLAGRTSAYFGWTESVYAHESADTTSAFFDALLRGETTATAYAELERAGKTERSAVSIGRTPVFEKIGPHAEELRIIDLPSLRQPTSTARLEDGMRLDIIGTPGDGDPDKVELVADVTGVIDPDDTGGGVGTSQAAGPAELYDLAFFVDDDEVNVDNLGRPRNETATTGQLDETTARYRFEAQLPFDVPEGGRDVTLRVETVLPEDGRESEHRVDVRLGRGCGWTMTVAGSDHDGTYQGDLVGVLRQPPTYLTFDDGPTGGSLPGLVIQTFERLPTEVPATLTLGLSGVPGHDGVLELGFDDVTYMSGDGSGCCTAEPTDTFPPPMVMTVEANEPDYVAGTVSGTVWAYHETTGTPLRTADVELDFTVLPDGHCRIEDPYAP